MMNLLDIIRVVRGVWDSWDVRGFMLLSFCLQTCLVVLAPLRTRTSNNWLIATLFCLYLLADWAANYAAGVISSSQGDTKTHKNQQPLAFWCTFLLVHLGGPDSITAFTLQDNDFWHRHALAILFQCISSTYIFFQTLRYNHLWIPTLLVFVSGFIKYYERTLSLYSASFNNLRDSLRKAPDPGPSYSKIMHVYRCYREANLPTRTEHIPEPYRAAKVKLGRLDKGELKLYAYQFFEMIKRLVVDLKCTHHERKQSREFFLKRTAEQAFELIAIELNFLYDILFTKASVLYTRKGCYLRLFSFALMVAAFGLFYCEEKGEGFSRSDVAISYTLLLGAIAFDLISFIRLITTDWVITAFTRKLDDDNWLIPPTIEVDDGTLEKRRRRWSESVSTLGLIEYCLFPRRAESQEIMDRFGLTSYFDGLKYVKRRPFTEKLSNRIFGEVRIKSAVAEDLEIAREASAARGDWVLRLEPDCSHLLHYVVDMDYDHSLLSWHIATELCWYFEHGDDDPKDDAKDHAKRLSDYMMYLVRMQPAIMYGVTEAGQTRLRDTCAEIKREYWSASHDHQKQPTASPSHDQNSKWCAPLLRVFSARKKEKREWSPSHDHQKQPTAFDIIKYGIMCLGQALIFFLIGIFSPALSIILSLFVVMFEPMIKTHKYCHVNLENCKWCAPLLRVFSAPETEKEKEKAVAGIGKEFCTWILNIDAEIEPVGIKGDKSKSVLFDGCRLAKEIRELGDRKWEILSRVWVEMLTYAAVRCRPQTLAQPLSRGGELISFVWLLMAHFGLVDQFDVGGLHRAKLIVDK